LQFHQGRAAVERSGPVRYPASGTGSTLTRTAA